MRYIVLEKRYDMERNQMVYGVRDAKTAIWVSESYSQYQCQIDADYLNELSQGKGVAERV